MGFVIDGPRRGVPRGRFGSISRDAFGAFGQTGNAAMDAQLAMGPKVPPVIPGMSQGWKLTPKTLSVGGLTMKNGVAVTLPAGSVAFDIRGWPSSNPGEGYHYDQWSQTGDVVTIRYPTTPTPQSGRPLTVAIWYRVPQIQPAKYPPPASYPIQNASGFEPLDDYLPAVIPGKRYGGLAADRGWTWLSWRKRMVWGTGDDPGNMAVAWMLLTPKERSFRLEGDALRPGADSWLQRNAWVPAVVLGVAGGIAAIAAAPAAAAAGAAGAGGGAVAGGGAAAAGGAAVAGTTTAVATTAPTLASLAGYGSMVGGFGAGIGGAAAVVPTSLATIVGAGATAAGGIAATTGGITGTTAATAGGGGLSVAGVAAKVAPLLTKAVPVVTNLLKGSPDTGAPSPTSNGPVQAAGMGGLDLGADVIAGVPNVYLLGGLGLLALLLLSGRK